MKRFLILTGTALIILSTAVYAEVNYKPIGTLFESISKSLNRTSQLDVKDEEPENKENTKNKEATENRENSENTFAQRMNALMPTDKNYVFSPLSLKYALAMTANGADSETRAEITGVLDIADLNSFNDEVKAYLDEHTLQTEDSSYFDEPMSFGTSLNIANSVWLNSDYALGGDFSEEYKALVADKYGATAENVTNQNAVQKINSWCSDKTNGKIPTIVNDSDFLACLVNAVYFNARWSKEFYKGATHKADFTDRNGNISQLDFMEATDHFNYYEDDKVKLVSMPYEGSSISMYLALSNDKRLDFESYPDNMEYKKVHITMPKFKIEYGMDATELLSELGITKAFDSKSQASHFAEMFNDTVNSNMNAYVGKVVQKAYIDVDEEGTEAAAVTAVMLNATAAMPMEEEIFEFKADTPFTYFIRDNSTGEILFMGEYAFAE